MHIRHSLILYDGSEWVFYSAAISEFLVIRMHTAVCNICCMFYDVMCMECYVMCMVWYVMLCCFISCYNNILMNQKMSTRQIWGHFKIIDFTICAIKKWFVHCILLWLGLAICGLSVISLVYKHGFKNLLYHVTMGRRHFLFRSDSILATSHNQVLIADNKSNVIERYGDKSKIGTQLSN